MTQTLFNGTRQVGGDDQAAAINSPENTSIVLIVGAAGVGCLTALKLGQAGAPGMDDKPESISRWLLIQCRNNLAALFARGTGQHDGLRHLADC